MMQENEIPKYLKSTESNISKSNRKSKHKHHYEECLIQYDSTFVGKINRYRMYSCLPGKHYWNWLQYS